MVRRAGPRQTGILLRILLAGTAPIPLAAQIPASGQNGATVGSLPDLPSRSPLVTWRSATLMTVVLGATMVLDDGVREAVQAHRSPVTDDVARIGNRFGEVSYLFPVLGGGWIVSRVLQSERLEGAMLQAGEAVLVASGVTGVLKVGLGRLRPSQGEDADHFRPLQGKGGFPSGHTTVAFAAATALARATPDRWSDVALYALASLTGLSRMNNDVHWASDVVAGATVGYLVGRYIVPRTNNGGETRPKTHFVVNGSGIGVSVDF